MLNKIIKFYQKHEQTDREAYGAISNINEKMEVYLFKFIEKLFKIISWLVYLSLIMYLSNKTHSKGTYLLSLFLKSIIYSYITLLVYMNMQKLFRFFFPRREVFSILSSLISSIICIKYVHNFINLELSHFIQILLKKFL